MLGIVKEISGQKQIIPLTTDTGTGAPVGTLIQQYKKKPMSGYLYCDGSTFDQNAYPALYMYLGSNVLPDYRECVMVGAEQNTTDTIATHDVYGEGEFKDDQLKSHTHNISTSGGKINMGSNVVGSERTSLAFGNGSLYAYIGLEDNAGGYTTHGKQKAVYVYIKATSGLAENQQDNVLNDVKDYLSGVVEGLGEKITNYTVGDGFTFTGTIVKIGKLVFIDGRVKNTIANNTGYILRNIPANLSEVNKDLNVFWLKDDYSSIAGISVLSFDNGYQSLSVGINPAPVGIAQISFSYITV